MVAPLKQVKRSLFHGRTMRLKFTVTIASVPMDLTGAKFALTAKRNIEDADVDAVFQVTTATVTTPASGIFVIEIPRESTDLIAIGNEPEELVYDVVIEDSGGDTYTLEYGRLKVYPSPTRAEDLV